MCCRLLLLAPRLPFLPALPTPPPPPVYVPGRGFMDLQTFLNTVAPPLARTEEIYLQSLTELARSQLGEHSLFLIFIFPWIGKSALLCMAL
jgi:hypothetical protein